MTQVFNTKPTYVCGLHAFRNRHEMLLVQMTKPRIPHIRIYQTNSWLGECTNEDIIEGR